MTTVSELQPDPNKVVRIVSYRQSSNGVFHDGIVRKVWQGDTDNDYGVVMYSPTYNRESTIYVNGTDEVVEPNRNVGAAHDKTGEQRKFEREFNEKMTGP
ncbi:hypothetical protein AB0F03_37940 [Streptomyces sp. NPDC028722]|uniref:hypothetical protein n=1 Tax=Streptomyces sp. NPDC028722 TaxID=3155016 RepID=UPI0033C73004